MSWPVAGACSLAGASHRPCSQDTIFCRGSRRWAPSRHTKPCAPTVFKVALELSGVLNPTRLATELASSESPHNLNSMRHPKSAEEDCNLKSSAAAFVFAEYSASPPDASPRFDDPNPGEEQSESLRASDGACPQGRPRPQPPAGTQKGTARSSSSWSCGASSAST